VPKIDVCAGLSAISPSNTTSWAASTAGFTALMSVVRYSLSPSARRISARYVPNGCAVLVTTRMGPPGPPFGGGPVVVNVHVTSAASGSPAALAMPLAPLCTVAVYAVEGASGADGVSTAVCVPDS
jgi:hypothetical protein